MFLNPYQKPLEKDLIYLTITTAKLWVGLFSNHSLVDKIEFMNNI